MCIEQKEQIYFINIELVLKNFFYIFDKYLFNVLNDTSFNIL